MDCVIQCLMDMQFVLFVCLFDGRMDGCSANNDRKGCAGGAAPPPPCKPSIDGKVRKTQSYAARFLCSLVAWFVDFAALLLGWLAPRC